jgi:hypothetical protein
MVRTDPGSLSTASVARTHGGGNTPRPATTPGITERNVVGIVTGLTAAGDAVNDKQAAGRGHRTHGNATDQSDQQHECEVALPPAAEGGGEPVPRNTHDPWQTGLGGQQGRAREPHRAGGKAGTGPVSRRCGLPAGARPRRWPGRRPGPARPGPCAAAGSARQSRHLWRPRMSERTERHRRPAQSRTSHFSAGPGKTTGCPYLRFILLPSYGRL